MPKSVCIFDFDGTICDSVDACVKVMNKVCASHGYAETTMAELRAVPARKGLKLRGIPLVRLPFLVLKARKELATQAATFVPFPGIPEALRELRERYKLLIVTSNSRQLVEAFLRKNQCDYFEEVHSELDLFGKAQRLRKVLHQHLVAHDQAVFIGDETRDVEAARKLKIASIAVTWGFNSRELLESCRPDRIVSSPNELCRCIELLE